MREGARGTAGARLMSLALPCASKRTNENAAYHGIHADTQDDPRRPYVIVSGPDGQTCAVWPLSSALLLLSRSYSRPSEAPTASPPASALGYASNDRTLNS